MRLHSDACTALVAEFEGFRAHAYQDQAGIWTIGYGSTRIGGGRPVIAGDVTSEPVARIWLSMDLDRTDICINSTCLNPETINTVSQNQFDALVSLAYNIGCSALGHSELLKLFNAGEIQGGANQFLVWDKTHGEPNEGLLNRRKRERELFLTP